MGVGVGGPEQESKEGKNMEVEHESRNQWETATIMAKMCESENYRQGPNLWHLS